MKTLFCLTVALIAFAVTPVHAQQSTPVRLLAGTTWGIAASQTSNYTAVASVRACNTAGIQTHTKLDGAGTEAVVFKFAKSADGSVFETTPSILITNTCTGATDVDKFSAIDVTGVHTIKLTSIVNGSAANLTNIYAVVHVKNFTR